MRGHMTLRKGSNPVTALKGIETNINLQSFKLAVYCSNPVTALKGIETPKKIGYKQMFGKCSNPVTALKGIETISQRHAPSWAHQVQTQ